MPLAALLARAFPAQARLPRFLVLPMRFQSMFRSLVVLDSQVGAPMEAESPGTFSLATQGWARGPAYIPLTRKNILLPVTIEGLGGKKSSSIRVGWCLKED